MGNLNMLSTLIPFPWDRGDKRKKDPGERGKEEGKDRDNFLVARVGREIFNIEDHALSYASEAVPISSHF